MAPAPDSVLDPITHTLTGLALSRAGLKRVSPRATGILLLAANAPDCDLVSAFTTIGTSAAPKRDLHPALRKAELDGLRSQIEDLKRELREYEALRSGKRRTIALDSIEELSTTLIQARIAAGLSQEELVARLGLKPQQAQRYEATDYRTASLERVNEIVRVLGIKLRHPAELRLVS